MSMMPQMPQFMNQQRGNLQKIPVRGVLSRRQVEQEHRDTQKLMEPERHARELLTDNPSMAMQIYQSLQGSKLPAMPITGE